MTTKEIDINGIPHEVTYTIHEGEKGVWTLPNGDPGYPDDPTEIEVHEVVTWTEDGEEIDVTEQMRDAAYEVISEI